MNEERRGAGMKVGIIGAGNMGRAIAGQLAGGEVLLADRNPDKAKAVVAEIGGGVTPSSMDEALAADMVVLALWYPGTVEFAREHATQLAGKTVIDISIPLDETWIRLSTDPSTSAAELLAKELPDSSVVKAFNTDTAIALGAGEVGGTALDVFVASDDEQAKKAVMKLVQAAGLRPLDAGRLDNARFLERLTAFQMELSQRYGLEYDIAFKVLPTELPAGAAGAESGGDPKREALNQPAR